jgi:hypothetical protein
LAKQRWQEASQLGYSAKTLLLCYVSIFLEMSHGKINSRTSTSQENVLQAAVCRICTSEPKQIRH